MIRICGAAAGVLVSCAGLAADVFPTLGHSVGNAIPFGSGQSTTMHQVFDADLFSTATGGLPAVIESIAFAPMTNGAYTASITIRLGYTNRTPGVNPPAGLDPPDLLGLGTPNASGAMAAFYANAAYAAQFAGAVSENFQMVFPGTPFTYDPTLGNLLVEVVTDVPPSPNINLNVSRASGGPESSRSFAGSAFTGVTPTAALRMDFVFTFGTGGGCYANCDESTTPPVLNVADFTCFLQAFAAGAANANCDESTTAPVLNVADFTCFLQAFAAGCP